MVCPVLNGSVTTHIVGLGSLPVVHEVWSHRACTPSLTEGEVVLVSSVADTEVKGDTVTGYEGPTIYKLNGKERWCLLLDYFSKSQGYKPFVTDDITEGSFVSASDFTFDATYRHGTVIPITTAEYKSLIEKYNK